ncbi:hemerythrin domain-containing protein [Thauera linaloolentis]|uniref:Hemerythrin HHE cation binding domain-containing protein n=1 Tax=Thauera linaloolentis (strain DSM 12138 / JCM 21573 / CCUG 41526 / CIP 105981 / IAM 15112 / NBRC 102519 / 47Lol) TaxID=1123367 RepID=N6XZL2_THAL4|nr:hemerythrin domain-containing protein [Thauera linaloolentis]ENO87281.1 hemerythrin HHE cation binding domain-containing protein [Thauera linaloolentis 47Lol = DSM 12138]MCM8566731.1 hemerythrin [Thauera linaloolentis]
MTQATIPAQGMPWSDHYLLGHAGMDDTHREFVELVDRMLGCADDDFAAALRAFIVHAEAHFGEEKAMMEATDFPATECHVDDHEAVYASALEVEPLVRAGNVAIGRAFAAELARWFPSHADYLDSALAHWVVKRSTGGKPVVLKRNIAVRAE